MSKLFVQVERVEDLIGRVDDYFSKPKKQNHTTNADRIRQMTEEELATVFNGVESDGRAYGPRGYVSWYKWLKQECDPNE